MDWRDFGRFGRVASESGLREEVEQAVIREEIKAVKYYLFILEALLDYLEGHVHCPEVLAQAQARAEAEHGGVFMVFIRRLPDLFVDGCRRTTFRTAGAGYHRR
jgi:hypothetical protein